MNSEICNINLDDKNNNAISHIIDTSANCTNDIDNEKRIKLEIS